MTENYPTDDSDGGVDQLGDADELSQAIHDLRVAKKEIDNYHAGGKSLWPSRKLRTFARRCKRDELHERIAGT